MDKEVTIACTSLVLHNIIILLVHVLNHRLVNFDDCAFRLEL